MPETRKLVGKISPEDADAIRSREELLSFYRRTVIILNTEKRMYLLTMLRKMGKDTEKQYYVDPDANLFEVIPEMVDTKPGDAS